MLREEPLQTPCECIDVCWLLPALKSIGDAVVATDANRRVVFMNPVAERLTGWKLGEALGRPLEEVVVLVGGGRRQAAASAADRALPERTAATHANHTILISRDGTQYAVDDGEAGFHDEAGECRGAVLVFRDVTEARQAEERLAESRRRLEAILNGIGDGIIAQTRAGKLVFANDAAARVTGATSAEELEAAPITAILADFEMADEDGRPLGLEDLPASKVLAGAPSAEATIRFRRRGHSETRWALVKASPVLDGSGEPVLAISFFEDITDRRAMDAALRSHEHLLATTLRSIGDAVMATDPSGRITFLNPVGEDLTGWTEPRAKGRPIREVLNLANERTREAVEIPAERALRDRMVVGLANHTVLIRPDGAETPIDDSAAPILDPGGRILGSVLVFRDVTARRRSRDALERQAQLLELAHDIIMVHDMGNRITFWNHAAEEMYGYSREEAVGRIAYEMLMTRFPTSFDDVIRTLRETGRWDGDLVHTKKDGAQVMVASRWALQRDAEGEPVAILEICRDITDQRRAASDILALNARLQRAMSETHHRVKNNLQIISALIDLQVLQDEKFVPVRELARLAQHVRALAAIHDLLTQQAKVGGDAENVGIHDIMDRLLPMLQAVLQDRTVRLSAGDVLLPARQGTALAVLVNELVSNAAKHAKSGDIDVQVCVAGGRLMLEVSDNGPGFPQGFDPETAASTGLELVMSLARWDLQGSVRFENRAEGGGRVIVEFPL